MRQVVLDTETTGIDPTAGHRIIEIGCVELENRRFTGRTYHSYINPEREIEEDAIRIHGITSEFLADKPRFAQIATEFLDFIKGAELIIHNAAFDVGFMDAEFARINTGLGTTKQYCTVLDTLGMARKLHPGQRNSLDALCKRYAVDNSKRIFHGALLDAEILADVYLLMTGGQISLALSAEAQEQNGVNPQHIKRFSDNRAPLRVIYADDSELLLHQQRLAAIEKASSNCLWLKQDALAQGVDK
jgi:DNA polymerase-3 subunit epsilon